MFFLLKLSVRLDFHTSFWYDCPLPKEVADMRTTIEELYYGNIMPYNRSVRAGSEYANLVGLLARNEAELIATLTEAQKETFEKIKDCWMEMNSINEVTIFTHGFKLGLRLTAESLISSKNEQEPITE